MTTTQFLVTLILVVGGIASLITSITVIANFTKKIKNSLVTTVEDIVKVKLEENNKHQSEKLELILQNLDDKNSYTIQDISKKLDLIIKQTVSDKESSTEEIKLLKQSLMEVYKQEIRVIYYSLRETGFISDHDKAYVDKVMPLYRAIGGNSDIEAKYAEMVSVSQRRTQEKYDELFKLNKIKKIANKVKEKEAKTTKDTLAYE